MIQSSSPKPLATGRLSKTPFPHLLLYLYEHRYSGTLSVQGEEQIQPTRIRFLHGCAEAALTTQAAESLSMVLMPLCGLTEGDYSFFEDEDFVGRRPAVVTGRIDPYPFLARALRVHACDSAVDVVLARYETADLELVVGVDLKRFGLRDDEQRAVDLLASNAMSIIELGTASNIRPQKLRRLLYLLLITKVVVPGRKPASPGGPGFSNFPPPATAGRASIMATAAVTQAPAGPGSSGVWGSPDANDGSSHDWRGLVRGSQPPPVPSVPPAPLMPAAVGVPALEPAAVSQAPAEPLPGTDPNRPVTASWPTVPPAEGAPAERHPSEAPPPSTHPAAAGPSVPPPGAGLNAVLRRVELLCERQHYGEALRTLDPLLGSHANEARVHAMRAWVIFFQAAGEPQAPDALGESVALALRLDPLQPRALYVGGLQRKREGRMVEAQRYFARACGLDIDALGAEDAIRLAAERELRLSDMRRRGK